MKISLAQIFIDWENKDSNLLRAEEIIKTRAEEGDDSIFFPEMSFTGFSMNTDKTAEPDGYTQRKISEIAQKYKINIGFGWTEKSEIGCRNMYSVAGKSGDIISTYAKIHPFSYSGEDKRFVGGEEMVTFSLDGIPFSNFICYDLRFPELFRAVSDSVHAIVVPACWPAKRSEHWKALLRARAIENQVYIFAVNCQGNMGGLYYSGDSCVISPDGEIIDMLSDSEGVLSYDFEDNVEKYRESFPVLNDKKGDIYRKSPIRLK